MKKLYLILILGMFLISFANAEVIGTFKQGQEMQITNYCSTADCTSAKLSSIKYPNGTIIYLDESMTKNGNEFNYTYTPSELGEYYFTTCSNPNGVDVCEMDSFIVNPKGISFNPEEVKFNVSSIYFLAIFGFIFILLGFLFLEKDSLWVRWSGVFMLIIGLIVFYYDLSLVTMYLEYTSVSGSSVTGVFVLFARIIKLLPYITILIIIFAFVKFYRKAIKTKKSSDGWDENLF